MNTFIAVIQTIAIIGVPLLILRLRETKLVKGIGTVGVAYLLGIIVALVARGINLLGASFSFNSDVSEIGSHAAIALAIPLLLFGTNLKALKQLSKSVLGSFGLLSLSVAVITVVVFFSMRSVLTAPAGLAGMAMGLYTGGTPNLNAIGNILGLGSELIAVANISDMLIGGIFYLFLLVACKPLLKKILPSAPKTPYTKGELNVENVDDLSIKNIDKKPLLVSFGASFLCAAIGAGIGLAVWAILGAKQGTMIDYLVPCLLVTATVLGIAGSFIPKLRNVKGNNLLGQYFILVFSFALAMSVDVTLIDASFLYVFLFYSAITIGTFLLHTLLCRLFKIDVDCAMITLTAGVYGPAFIPAVSKQIKNDGLLAPGLICGSLGYAMGTFLGIGLAYLLMLAL